MLLRCLAILFLTLVAATPGYSRDLATYSTYERLEMAWATQQPTLLIVGTENCPYCSRMHPVWGQVRDRFAGKINLLYSDFDSDREFAVNVAGVESVPTHIFFDKRGMEVYRFTGVEDVNYFVEIFRQLSVY